MAFTYLFCWPNPILELLMQQTDFLCLLTTSLPALIISNCFPTHQLNINISSFVLSSHFNDLASWFLSMHCSTFLTNEIVPLSIKGHTDFWTCTIYPYSGQVIGDSSRLAAPTVLFDQCLPLEKYSKKHSALWYHIWSTHKKTMVVVLALVYPHQLHFQLTSSSWQALEKSATPWNHN